MMNDECKSMKVNGEWQMANHPHPRPLPLLARRQCGGRETIKVKVNNGRRKIWFLLSAISYWLLAGKGYAAVGLSTRFVDVTLENLQVGVAYNLRELKKVPYTIKNLSGATMNVSVEVRIPKQEELQKDYEPIPDPNWVQIVPNQFVLEPGRTGFAQVIIQIPNDPQYIGRHFHAKIWADTANNPYMLAAGVVSNLKFSAGLGPETLHKQKVTEAMMTLDFDVTPPAIYIDELEPGKPYDFKKRKARTLKVTNRSETQLRLTFASVPWDDRFHLGDYQKTPKPEWLTFKSTVAVVQPDTIQSVYPVLQIPDEPEHYGKRYAFLVQTGLVLGVELEYFNRIYVRVKEKGQ